MDIFCEEVILLTGVQQQLKVLICNYEGQNIVVQGVLCNIEIFDLLSTILRVGLLFRPHRPPDRQCSITWWILGGEGRELHFWLLREPMWLSGYSAGFVIWSLWVQVAPWLLAGFVVGSSEFKSSSMLSTGLPPTSWDS